MTDPNNDAIKHSEPLAVLASLSLVITAFVFPYRDEDLGAIYNHSFAGAILSPSLIWFTIVTPRRGTTVCSKPTMEPTKALTITRIRNCVMFALSPSLIGLIFPL